MGNQNNQSTPIKWNLHLIAFFIFCFTAILVAYSFAYLGISDARTMCDIYCKETNSCGKGVYNKGTCSCYDPRQFSSVSEWMNDTECQTRQYHSGGPPPILNPLGLNLSANNSI